MIIVRSEQQHPASDCLLFVSIIVPGLCGDDVRDYDDQSAAGLVITGWDTVYTAELINASQQTYQAVLGQACAVSNCV